MVLSATYRQDSSASAELIARDPENRLLARGPRFRLSAEAIRDQALAAARAAPGADLCFLSCTAIRSAGVIAALEAALGMPVITSNQAMLWHGLRAMGIGDAVAGFGRLMDIR
ncbi:MAG TPA: DUF1553 domain-containing protein, partial [Roseomonas sp.]